MPTHSRKPKLTYSLTKLYDGRSCLVLAPLLPPPLLPSTQESSCSSSASASSPSPALLSKNQPSIQSMSSSSTHRLFQPYPPHFPSSRTIASSHRNLYLYKETQAEIIQRDKRLALREAAYKEFHARMADESRANHVGVTTRSAAAAAVSSFTGEQHPKRSSRAAPRANDPLYNITDDPDSPPRKKARTTARTANNNKPSNANSANTQTTRKNDSNSAKIAQPAVPDITTHHSSTRLTTRSQTKSRRVKRPSPTAQDNEGSVLQGEIDIEQAAPVSVNEPESQPPTAQDLIDNEEPVSAPNEVDIRVSQSVPEEKSSSPGLSTPRTTLGRALSTSSTLASSRQSSDDGFRKSDQRFPDGLSIDGDANLELGDAEPPASGNDSNASLTRKSNEPLSPSFTSSDIPASSQADNDAAAKIFDGKESEGSDTSQSLPSRIDRVRTATQKTGRANSPRKRSHPYDEEGDGDEPESNDSEQNTSELPVVIPPEVRRSGRVSKKRKLE